MSPCPGQAPVQLHICSRISLQVRTQHLDEDELAGAPRASGPGVGVGQLGDGAVVEPPGGAARLEARGALEGAGHQEAGACGEEELGRGGRRH